MSAMAIWVGIGASDWGSQSQQCLQCLYVGSMSGCVLQGVSRVSEVWATSALSAISAVSVLSIWVGT